MRVAMMGQLEGGINHKWERRWGPLVEYPSLGPSPERSTNTPLRAVLAILIFLPLLVASLAYHDGVIGIDSTKEVSRDGSYRLKGLVALTGGSDDDRYFDFRDDEGGLRVRWNATTVEVGTTYVVVGTFDAAKDSFQGDAVVQALIFT